ncbi:MAG: hypothetical protein QM601_06050 [Pseudoxanthomonas sp.]
MIWNPRTDRDRRDILLHTLDYALRKQDPYILAAAYRRDARMEAEGNQLDGIIIYRHGPLPDSHLYLTRDRRFVRLYRRRGDGVEIERVMPARSSWQDETT